MEKKSICGGKYKFSNQTISLPVNLGGLPIDLVIDGNTLELKSSFHVSLVCIGEIIKKRNVPILGFEEAVIEDFCSFVEKNSIELLGYNNDFKFVEKGDLKSLVVMCDVSNLDKFFDLLNSKYYLDLEYPPTHVTLYTMPSKPGIFLCDKDDVQIFSKKINRPEGVRIF